MIVFAAISPHPPIILPSVGSGDETSISSSPSLSHNESSEEEDRKQVKETIKALESLGERLKEIKPETIIISSPHPDWGFEVPLYFLAKDFQEKIEKVLIGLESPQFYFEKGKKLSQKLDRGRASNRLGLIASGDLSHCLREDGPYGFHPQGPKFDKELIESLKNKDIENILKLDNIYPEAGECGLRSFSFLLGMMKASGVNWKAEILSYQGPFGVGYLVANFQLK